MGLSKRACPPPPEIAALKNTNYTKFNPNLISLSRLMTLSGEEKGGENDGTNGTAEALEASPPYLICTRESNSVFTAFLLPVFRQRTCPIAHGLQRCWWMDDCGITSWWKTNHPNGGGGGKHLAASRKRLQKPTQPLSAFFQQGDERYRGASKEHLCSFAAAQQYGAWCRVLTLGRLMGIWTKYSTTTGFDQHAYYQGCMIKDKWIVNTSLK